MCSKKDDKDDKEEKDGFVERREEIYLSYSVLGDKCAEELKETDKHEIIAKINEVMGDSPENLTMAEKIFEQVRFEVTKYVLHHEYCREKKSGVRSKLLLWLETKINPKDVAEISNFFSKYIK